MTLLFDVEQYTTVKTVHDPFWDEVILDAEFSGRDENGQLTLFYDDSQEPPEPDDCDSLAEFELRFSDWQSRFPMPEGFSVLEEPNVDTTTSDEKHRWQKNYRGYTCKFFKLPNNQIQWTVYDDYLLCGTFQGNYNTHLDAELDAIEFINETYPGERVPPPDRDEMMSRALDDVLEESDFNDGDFIELTLPFPELPEQDLQPHTPTLPEQRNNQWVEEYYVKRSGVKHWYFRYCYYVRGIHHIHIPGGNYENPMAIDRKQMVESAIAQGKSPSEIKNFIRGGFGMNGYKL